MKVPPAQVTERTLPKLKHLGLRESVVQSIREAIQSGWLRPGERVVEADLAAELGVSRAPIREALRQLEQEGLLENVPRHGTVVVKFSPEDVLEIYSLRSVLEGLACRMAAERITEDDRQRLHGFVVRMREAAVDNDVAGFVDLDLRLHEALCELSCHRRLLNVWRSLNAQLRVFLFWKEQIYKDLMDAVDKHLPILDALDRGDGDAADNLIREHIMKSERQLVDWMGS